MKIDMNGVIYSLTYALDCIESELVGVSEDHAKWVTYVSILLGKQKGYSKEELSDLAACAALHDNALTESLSEERNRADDILGRHCELGEQNVKCFPFYGNTNGFILYHHENVDGSGPFKKKMEQIPYKAHIIHLADLLDVACHIKNISEENYNRMESYLNQQRGKIFSDDVVDAFFSVLSKEKYLQMKEKKIDDLLSAELPHQIDEYPFEQVRCVMSVFGKIVDYKSPFTRSHSENIAKKVLRMSEHYHYDSNSTERLYVAGVLHDIGKMAIRNDVLEKPDKLTNQEFAYMQNHAWYTYVILNQIDGFEDITEWASFHHEKLNGKGYPFGKKADQLSQKDRLLACIDIYQALSEDRPYKKGIPHEKCMTIMKEMAENGFIDTVIVNDIDYIFA